ncbi:MAG: sigma-54 dependent transcriptional regulator [Planctomycetota bacterium]
MHDARDASNPESHSILIVDDEDSALQGMRRVLRSHGFEHLILCSDSREALGLLQAHRVNLVLLDLIMPHLRGEDLLAQIARRHPDVPVIVVTADIAVQSAVRCGRLGASDYIVKPVEAEQLIAAVTKALEQSALRYEAERLREQFLSQSLHTPSAFTEITTADPAMLRLFQYLEAVSRGGGPVLITGETGTGKELIARALHRASHRNGPFVAVNVGGLDDALFADTLFGHEEGAYTGATMARPGMIERAGDGTLFLDEIGDLSEASQVKLLRLIQERDYFPLGSDTQKRMLARIVAATQKEPQRLRQDLYYRLRTYHVRVPPLCERLGDLPLLLDRFLTDAAKDLGKPKPATPPELLLDLSNYHFPGNVRELQAMVFGAVARHDGHGTMPIRLFLDQMETKQPDYTAHAIRSDKIGFPFPMPTLRDLEQAAVDEAMRRVDNNQSAAARMLGISRPTIARYLRRVDEDAKELEAN